MTGRGSSGAAGTATKTVCTACSLLCEDIVRGTASRPLHACDRGAAAFVAAAAAGSAAGPDLATAVARAAAVATSARRVLLTGLTAVPNEAIVTACDLAESLGAVVDAGAGETARIAGPTIARIGAVTADWEELRDRADLVVFWFCDPSATHPRFLERFVAPTTATRGPRRTIAIGPQSVSGPGHTHCLLPRSAAVAAARLLQATSGGCGDGPAAVAQAPADLAAAVAPLAAALAAAGCVAFVTCHDADPVGIEPWAVGSLVRHLAHSRPAFEVPLDSGTAGANAAGMAAICTWRYGAAGAIARADRLGGDFLPAECDARRLIDRGEIDCVIAVGSLPAALDAAVAARPDLAVIRIAPGSLPDGPPRPGDITIGCESLLAHPWGSMLRGDGRRVVIGPPSAGGGSLPAILALLTERIRDRSTTGGCE